MSNEQQSILRALAQENGNLRRSLAQVGTQIAALEEQVYSLETSLQKVSHASAAKAPDGVEGTNTPDPVVLTRENVCLRAKLDYSAETIARIEEALLHLCDVIER